MTFLAHLAVFRQTIEGDFVPAIEAERFVKIMERDHPDEYAEWLRANAVRFCAESFGDLLRSERAKAVRRAGARAFHEAVEEHEAGDSTALSMFAVVYEIGPDHTRRSLAEMTGADHRYVADRYEVTGKRSLMLASFHRAVAKKVGMQRTDAVFTEETIERLRRSILNPPKKGNQAA